MNKSQRIAYHTRHWPAAAQAQRIDPADNEARRQTTIDCMTAIGCPGIDSTTALDQAQITALFTYLQFLANPDSIIAAAKWNACAQDYIAFNLSRQADFHQRRAYGRRPGTPDSRLVRDRFAGRHTAADEPLDRPLTRGEAYARLTTMRARARARAA